MARDHVAVALLRNIWVATAVLLGAQAKPKNSANIVTVQAGSKSVVVAQCEAADGKPAATIKWLASVGGNHSTTTTNGPDGTVTVRSEYRLVPTPADNGREVTCLVDQRTQERPWVFPVKLSVEYPPSVSIEGYDNNWYVGRSDAMLLCLANANPAPISVIWTAVSGSLPETVMVEDNKLMVKKVDDAVNTTFICEVKNKQGTSRNQITTFVIDDVVLLASSARELQLSLDRFAAACEAAGMKISTSKSEAMVLNRKKVECLLRVKEEILPQVEEFKYLGVLFTSEGRMEQEIDRQIGTASAVMRTLHRSVVVKRELSQKAKLSIYRLIFVPPLTYGHELWVMTGRTRSRVQAAEMSFLRRVAGLSLRDMVRSSAIREELGVEPLLLRVERSQMTWLGHLVRMPPGRLPGEVFMACPSGRRPPGRPRTRWRDYVSRLVWECLGIPPDELEEVAGEREVWASLLRLLPPRPDPG
ncbi:PVR cell adhesion molecule related 2 like isoform X5 [Takifugu flavidus]|uniref:PVR cell adhesion molecule related 2 like isoform X5 n=1 Tax=Takifugu flavidus TaxID=433684 RepID=UPI00254458A6|nr:PVR cell adhesion molecule related 2 like isoform X5 [Takifugu flavidus]